MSRFGELCTMENEMKIHSQLDETKLKLDSSSLYYEVGPTRPALAQRVSERSLTSLVTSHDDRGRGSEGREP